MTLSASRSNRILTLVARIAHDGQAIDMRMQCHRWMGDLEARGGRVVGALDPAGLAAIAAAVDLCLVAVGRGPLCDLFPRDVARSLRSEPPRELAMAVVRGPGEVPEVPFRPVKFNISPVDGEVFRTPYLHKDGGLTWALLVEAVPGRGFGRGRRVSSRVSGAAFRHGSAHRTRPYQRIFEELRQIRARHLDAWPVGR